MSLKVHFPMYRYSWNEESWLEYEMKIGHALNGLGDLLLTQVCGIDYMLNQNQWTLIGTPELDIHGHRGKMYSSFIFKSGPIKKVVINQKTSHSGFTALFDEIEIDPSEVLESSSHEQSLQVLSRGECQAGAIDSYSLHWLKQKYSLPQNFQLFQGRFWTAPPYVLEGDHKLETVREVRNRIQNLSSSALKIKAILPVEHEDYLSHLTTYEKYRLDS